ncbi:MAG: hypothetical protein HFH68_04210 [Lachnospiraceae bacterium]|nr:hypothetical protein [Lachnospiraceae bacterium]
MEVSDVLSVIAIIISIMTVFFEFYYTNHNNKSSLMSIYYSETYKKYLTRLVPDARIDISYNKQTKVLSGTDKLESVILDIRNDSLYFKYQNKNFYNKLIEKLNLIDDLLVLNGQKRLSEKAYKEFETELDDIIAKMYELINNNYTGRS